ncbi:MAG: hypothetical protein ACJAR0_003605 [Candidatus Azotimanducaceae bacterium]|jgi:hypothetical protein
MRTVSKSIVIIASLCLLAMQLSGMHYHVDENGKGAGVHSAHQHQVDSEHHQGHHQLSSVHDHKAEIDVSLPEQLSSIWAKLIPAIMACALAIIIVSKALHRPILSFLRTPARVRRRSRWRPPLRAPPIFL